MCLRFAVQFVLAAMWGLMPLNLSLAVADDDAKEFDFTLRTREPLPNGTGVTHSVYDKANWDAKKTAVVICDMWNEHWCKGATRRVADMAPRMNEVISAARDRGALIIHCPSSCMKHYADTPQRKLAMSVSKSPVKRPLKGWCHLDPQREGPLPIDDSDGGCDCVPRCEQGSPWYRQIDTIAIKRGDAITDSDEAYHLMKSRGVENVIVMGVHTNMCVLGRPFSIRQLVYQDLNVALMRDMTDTMYNPRSAPYVGHASGTDLVVEHIERYWCPTITSDQIIGGMPFVFTEDKRPHLVMIIAEDEYGTETTLPKLAEQHLRDNFRITTVMGKKEGRETELPGIESLEHADVALISVRRKAIPTRQMNLLRGFIEAGKPVVAIRTSSHAFDWRQRKGVPEGYALWPEFDREVLGADYEGHFGNNLVAHVQVRDGAPRHPVLAELTRDKFPVASSLYKNRRPSDGVTVLVVGTITDQDENEPVAWTHETKWGGKVFYTSLGHVGDFKLPAFEQLLINGIKWAAVKSEKSHAH